MWPQPVLEEVDNAAAGQRRVHDEVGRCGARDQASGGIEAKGLVAAGELPSEGLAGSNGGSARAPRRHRRGHRLTPGGTSGGGWEDVLMERLPLRRCEAKAVSAGVPACCGVIAGAG